MENKPLQINLTDVIASKNPSLAKKLPNFVVKLAEKIIQQDELNYILNLFKDKKGVEMVDAIIDYFNLKIEAFGIDKINENGRYVFAANHPLGGLEGHALIQIVNSNFGSVKFFANDILMNLKNYDSLLVPVNKHGVFSKDYAINSNEAYMSDDQILIFPAGLVSRKVKGKITDLEWKKNFITKAIESKRDVIPVFIDGRNTNFFYNLSNFRKFLGIKINIEMFLLPREFLKQKNKPLKLYFGEPISYSTFDKSKTPVEWAKYVKNIVYSLK